MTHLGYRLWSVAFLVHVIVERTILPGGLAALCDGPSFLLFFGLLLSLLGPLDVSCPSVKEILVQKERTMLWWRGKLLSPLFGCLSVNVIGLLK